MKFTSYLSRKQALNLQNTIFRCKYSDTIYVKKYVGKKGILQFCRTVGYSVPHVLKTPIVKLNIQFCFAYFSDSCDSSPSLRLGAKGHNRQKINLGACIEIYYTVLLKSNGYLISLLLCQSNFSLCLFTFQLPRRTSSSCLIDSFIPRG